jgi:hypothetical protein
MTAKNVIKENLKVLLHLFDHVQLNSIKYAYVFILYVVSIILQIQLPIIAECLRKLPFWQCKKKTFV